MKIIHVIQRPQLRGAEIFACQLSNHLLEKGHEVWMVALYPGDASLPFKGSIIELNRPIKKRFYDIKGWKRFSTLLKKIQPDLIQANAGDTLKFTASAKFIFNFEPPIIFRNANKSGLFINSFFKRKLNQFYLSKVSKVISVSKECEEDFIVTYNYPPEKITTVEIGIEKNIMGSLSNEIKTLFVKKQILLHIGSFVPEKNHLGLLRIFSEVNKKLPQTHLLLIGKGILEDKIRQEIKNFDLGERVTLLGYRTDVLDIIVNSKAFLLPSIIEGLPGVLLESMYCKTPVIAYDVGGIPGIVNSSTGSLIPVGDEMSFAKAVIRAVEYPDKVQIQVAYKIVRKKFMNIKISKRFVRAYKEVYT
ncbi:glycosyltransferase family 4 protein [Antarcticibacterium flavum]|uniref:Glycosyltransferase family 4 protein n=1 Tax=Antarcticibacterium flavum TaxID=2058175 RepID=A0A5B7X1V6_9FLAO|nr:MULTISPECIES: glycosyltransferase family 4 protein [Antarcticibacterium]MCM4158770.1 glycosyltransferase [Antarcticibacterium sp. W02-3]QCY68621.1 glycosyltransferase family 4 protein [Antarcticibacterium flavum]